MRRESSSSTPLAVELVGLGAGVPAQDGEARGLVGRCQLDQQPALEAALQRSVQERHRGRRAVGGEHDLGAGGERGLDRVEELLRRALLALEELDVVEQQHVGRAIALLERRDLVVLEGGEKLARERLGVRVAHRQAAHAERDVVADRLEEVGLADPRRTADEQRVVDLARQLGDRQRRRVREAVGGPDHECLERVAGLEVEMTGGRRRRRVAGDQLDPADRRGWRQARRRAASPNRRRTHSRVLAGACR